jgi:hypothetical protein
VAGGEGEQLDEGCGLPEAPGALLDVPVAYGNPKLTE